MMTAQSQDKELVINILSKSFDDNKSVNYIIKQDDKRTKRIVRLMEYAFDVCFSFGKVLLSDDRKGCALIVLPDKKRVTLQSIWWDLRFIVSCTGLSNVPKLLSRERKIKGLQPEEPLYYVWFIGVATDQQHKGIGGALLQDLIDDAANLQRTICLETSTLKNVPWYKKFGFTVYNELDLGYQLFLLKR